MRSTTKTGNSLTKLLWFASVALGACRVPTSVSPNIVTQVPAAAPASVLIVADSQLHNVAGASTRARSALLDRNIRVAIRPAALDLWSDLLLEEALQTANSSVPVLFLGDGANASCISEYARFLDVMSREQAPYRTWHGVLGNHDGFYMGNLTYHPDSPYSSAKENTWQGACGYNPGWPAWLRQRLPALLAFEQRFMYNDLGRFGSHAKQNTLTKTHAALLYLLDLERRNTGFPDPLNPNNWRTSGVSSDPPYHLFEATLPAVAGVPATRIVAGIAASPTGPAHPSQQAWRAFILQLVWLDAATAVLMLDTSDYTKRPPSGVYGAAQFLGKAIPGRQGQVSSLQIQQAEMLLAASLASVRGARYFVAGHHPLNDLPEPAHQHLAGIFIDPRFVLYLSGHTHYASKWTGVLELPMSTPKGRPGKRIHELNVGSTTDWPMEYGYLSYVHNPASAAILAHWQETAVQPAQPMLGDEHTNYGTRNRYLKGALRALQHVVSQGGCGLTPSQGTQVQGWRGLLGAKASNAQLVTAVLAGIELDRSLRQSCPGFRQHALALAREASYQEALHHKILNEQGEEKKTLPGAWRAPAGTWFSF